MARFIGKIYSAAVPKVALAGAVLEIDDMTCISSLTGDFSIDVSAAMHSIIITEDDHEYFTTTEIINSGGTTRDFDLLKKRNIRGIVKYYTNGVARAASDATVVLVDGNNAYVATAVTDSTGEFLFEATGRKNLFYKLTVTKASRTGSAVFFVQEGYGEVLVDDVIIVTAETALLNGGFVRIH